ncbi:phoH-like PhoH1 domain protein [Mycobacterium ulcerans str. Harvey]|uniref:PhoH-like PhoH1 domain protein n=1 Tax=Mycobacterium ulcerans str. Harvey TaxID=1299332 RepID=A0ABN0QSD3_MYCUL|nr:phoH-like PhoH1 domain protein [Mycobacterium ulcerans str. Harvey]
MGLLGSADENLRALERTLTASLHVRGNTVTLAGEPATSPSPSGPSPSWWRSSPMGSR